jgi:hypothetical protein
VATSHNVAVDRVFSSTSDSSHENDPRIMQVDELGRSNSQIDSRFVCGLFAISVGTSHKVDRSGWRRRFLFVASLAFHIGAWGGPG